MPRLSIRSARHLGGAAISSRPYLANRQVVADNDQVFVIEVLVDQIGLDVDEQVRARLHGWARDLDEHVSGGLDISRGQR